MTARLLFLLLTCLLLTVLRVALPAAVQLQRLRCEVLTNPEGIDATAPRLSWELRSAARPHLNGLPGAGSLHAREAGGRRERLVKLG
jgi:hypothetical protein